MDPGMIHQNCPLGVAWSGGRYCQSGFDCLGKVREAATWFQFSLLLLVVLRLYAVEMTLLRSVVGLPPFRVLFARVRGRHPLLAVVVSGFGKVVLCLIVLWTLVGFAAARAGRFQVLSIAVQAKNPPRQSCMQILNRPVGCSTWQLPFYRLSTQLE